MKKYSITIPAYKSRYLSEAIESVVAQTWQDWELIIVDDCSPEDLMAVVRPFLSDSRIHYYRNDRNCGAVHVVDNWNICLSYCTGDYVICMGDDDRLLPCCLAQYEALITKYPDLNVYHVRTEIIDGKGDVTYLQEPRPEWESVLSLVWNRWASRNRQFIGDFCYSVAYLRGAGGYYDFPLAWGSDDVTAVLAASDKGIANTQEIGFQYRENALTISSSTANARIKIQARRAEHDWFASFLSGLSASELSTTDQKYLKTIATPREQYFLASLAKECIDYIKGNPLRLLWCYRQLRQFRFPKSSFVTWYLKSVVNIIK